MVTTTFLVFIASLCVINASIISINIYDGDNKNKLAQGSSVRSCDNINCDQTCRRIGFPGGICVNGRCKCDIISNEINKETTDEKVSAPLTLEECNNQACDQLCRRLGFPGGACVGDRCDCDNFQPKKDILNMLIRCDTVACNDICHRLHYAGGMCIGGDCKCY